MTSARTTYQDGRGAGPGAAPGHSFVWVSLQDPSAGKLAVVQAEFGLPGALAAGLGPGSQVLAEVLAGRAAQP